MKFRLPSFSCARAFFSLLALLLWMQSAVFAQRSRTTATPDFYAEISADRDSLIVNDSCVVNIVLYANFTFDSIEQSPKQLNFGKGITVRPLPTRRETFLASTSRGHRFAMLWQSYRVSRRDVGKISWPAMHFKATLNEYEYIDDGWGGFFSAPQQRLVRQHKVSCKLPSFSLPIIERPKRTTRELLNSGRQVM